MKNAIIAALSLALVFFVLQSLGVFEAGSLVDRNYRSHFLKERTKAVNKAKQWHFAVLADDLIPQSTEAVEGLLFATEVMNSQGGLLGKKIVLDVRTTGSGLEEQRRTIQTFCDNFATAAVFGPPHTAAVPSLRALSQFHALPLISPMSQPDPLMPVLDHDPYVSLYPRLTLWTESLAWHLKHNGYKRILLIGHDDTASYAWIYANACDSAIRHTLPEAEIFRFNYTPPLNEDELQHFVELYAENRGLDAVVLAGSIQDILTTDRLWQKLNLHFPVYGSDLLHGADIPPLSFPLSLPACTLSGTDQEFEQQWHARNPEAGAPSIWTWLGASSLRLLCQAIEERGSYDADAVTDRVRVLVNELWRSVHPVVSFREMSAEPDGTDSAAQRNRTGSAGPAAQQTGQQVQPAGERETPPDQTKATAPLVRAQEAGHAD